MKRVCTVAQLHSIMGYFNAPFLNLFLALVDLFPIDSAYDKALELTNTSNKEEAEGEFGFSSMGCNTPTFFNVTPYPKEEGQYQHYSWVLEWTSNSDKKYRFTSSLYMIHEPNGACIEYEEGSSIIETIEKVCVN